jgi:hypothetical protein
MRNARWLLLPLLWLLPAAAPGQVPATVTARFTETDAVYPNPGKGWTTGPTRQPRFPSTVTYTRLNWMDVEPAEGRHDWSHIDKAIEIARTRGSRLAFRIMTANAHTTGYYCSPKWLFDLGCKSAEYLRGGDGSPDGGRERIPRIEPNYEDPIYVAKHGAFLRELGKRYDGNPTLEFLDIGSYGIWGEWHTTHPASPEGRRRIIDLYLAAFPRTPLVMMTDSPDSLEYAVQHGAGVRRDGVGSPGDARTWKSEKYSSLKGLADAWKKAPVVLEWYGNYEYMKKVGWSVDNAIQFMLENHVSLINDNLGEMPLEEMPRFMKLARLSGYRFVLRELAHPGLVARNGALHLTMQWSNVGVACLYKPFPLELYLLDTNGRVAARHRAKADAREWLPGDHRAVESIPVPKNLSPGKYTIAAAFVDQNGKPAIKLPINAPETGGIYRLSQVTVE